MKALLYFYLWILVCHWVADFVCQTDWQAKNKSSDNWALSKHVLSYTAVLFIGSGMGMAVADPAGVYYWPWLGWVAFNAGAHWVTDYFTSRLNSRLWKEQRVHDFFVGVGFDQLVHFLTLGLTLAWILS